MDAYPPDFLVHPAPLVLVVGLGAQAATTASGFAAELRRSLHHVLQMQGTTLETSVGDIILPRPRADYDSRTHRYGWHVVFVDKIINLHKAKQPTSLSSAAVPPKRSSLSPLTVGSLLHPDGIITPQWHKKYREDAPAIVVAVYEIWEQVRDSSPTRDHTLGNRAVASSMERERDADISARISDLKKIVADSGARLFVWLVVKNPDVDNPLLEDRFSQIRRISGLDNRSMFVISQSGQVREFCANFPRYCGEPSARFYQNIASKIKRKRGRSPVSPTKNPLSTQSTTNPISTPLDPSSSSLPPLSLAGWTLRYDYKLAVLSELRGDIDEAQRLYQSTYKALFDYLYHAILLPNTRTLFAINPKNTKSQHIAVCSKRWYEAKVLFDIIHFKIMKLCMLSSTPLAALSQFHAHIDQLSCLPDSAIACPPLSFIYYGWAVRQHRLFAELMDMASNVDLQLPYVGSTNSLNYSTSSMNLSSLYHTSAIDSTYRPFLHSQHQQILQHPGFWYFEAAQLNIVRKQSTHVLTVIELMPSLPASLIALVQGEKVIDHNVLTIELLTRSYEQFKKYKSARMTLFLANEIAKTYQQSGKHEMALKFFERIAKTYRKERWGCIIQSILLRTVECASAINSRPIIVESLIELLDSEVSVSDAGLSRAQTMLLKLLDTKAIITTSPESRGVIRLDMDQMNAFVHCNVQYQKQSSYVQTGSPLQITFVTLPTSPPQPIEFMQMTLEFSDARLNTVLKHNSETSVIEIDSLNSLQLCLVNEKNETNLRLHKGFSKVVNLSIWPIDVMDLSLFSVTLHLRTEFWDVDLVYKIAERKNENLKRRRWLTHDVNGDNKEQRLRWVTVPGVGELATLRVLKQQSRVLLTLHHEPPALVHELYELKYTIHNTETVEITGVMKLEVQGGDETDPVVQFFADVNRQQKSSNRFVLGPIVLAPNEIKQGIVWIKYDAGRAERTFESSIHYMHTSESVRAVSADELLSSLETISKSDSVRIALNNTFETSFVVLRRSCKPVLVISDANVHNYSINVTARPIQQWCEQYLIYVDVKSVSPWNVNIASITLAKPIVKESDGIELLVTPLGEYTAGTDAWQLGQVCRLCFEVSASFHIRGKPPTTLYPEDLSVIWCRANPSEKTGHATDTTGEWTRTLVPLPWIQRSTVNVLIHADALTAQYIGAPFCYTFTISNIAFTVAEVNATIELPVSEQEKLMFCGPRHMLIRLLPHHATHLTLHCVALCAGHITLPTLRCEVMRGNATGEKADTVISDALQVFVKP